MKIYVRSSALALVSVLTFLNVSLDAQEAPLFHLSTKELKPHDYEVTLHVNVTDNDFLYADYLTAVVDNPAVKFSEWIPSQQPISEYDKHFHKTKQRYH